jgi:hypothetical protein
MWTSPWTLGSLALSLPLVLALQVTPDSECAALCSDGSNTTLSDASLSRTNSSDIVCGDSEYSKTGKGIRFKNCLNCLQKSEATWEEESDVFWFLCKSYAEKALGAITNNIIPQITSDMPSTFVSIPTLTRWIQELPIRPATSKVPAGLSKML